MKKEAIRLFVVVFALAAASGCARVRTYTVEQERVDQDLSLGNAGYLAGAPQQDLQAGRKLTRTTYVAEVELGKKPGQRPKGRKPKYEKCPMTMEKEEGATEEMTAEAPAMAAPAGAAAAKESVTYTVTANDTLQKISLKFYGTTKKWKAIFEANKEVLKSPDKIYAGQVIKIPQE
jgi:nucleoid-associated protein YgaU